MLRLGDDAGRHEWERCGIMSVTINHQTNDISTTGSPLTIGGAPVGGGGSNNIDGGSASTVYTAPQSINGGAA